MKLAQTSIASSRELLINHVNDFALERLVSRQIERNNKLMQVIKDIK
jgi:hypothetical protein